MRDNCYTESFTLAINAITSKINLYKPNCISSLDSNNSGKQKNTKCKDLFIHIRAIVCCGDAHCEELYERDGKEKRT